MVSMQIIKSKIDWFCNKRAYSTCAIDGIFGMYWGECSKSHDRRYENNRLTRYQADKLLYRCINRRSNPFIASVYFIGVRAFGWVYYNKDI